MTRDDLMYSRKASELQVLATPSRLQPTLAARRETLAFFYARGMTMPDNTATAASRAAWAARNAPRKVAAAPVLAVHSPAVLAPTPAAAALPQPDLQAHERATVAGLKALIDVAWRNAKCAATTAEAQRIVASINDRRDALMLVWQATGRPVTAQINSEVHRLAKACRNV